jgi:hypothetical protein
MVLLIIATTGCNSERKHAFTLGDKVVVTSINVNGTGTVIKVELGSNLSKACAQNSLYYQVLFGSVTNNTMGKDAVWVPEQFMKSVGVTQ